MNNQQHKSEQIIQEKQNRIEYENILAKKPKKPFNAYFKFRAQKLNELGNAENRNMKIKEAWQQLSAQAKQNLEKEYKIELAKHRQQMEQWKKQFEKYAHLGKVQRTGPKSNRIIYEMKQTKQQEQTCVKCSMLLKQKSNLQQQIKIIQQDHAKALYIINAQQRQIESYKQQNQKLRQQSK